MGQVYLCSYNNNTKEGVSFVLTPSHKITMTYPRLERINSISSNAKLFFICSTSEPTQEVLARMFTLHSTRRYNND